MKKSKNAIQSVDLIESKVYDIVKQIGTRSGFFEYYFSILPRCKNNTKAFHVVNEIYCLVFKQYKYSNYNSFKKQLTNYIKN
jgi:hypothetical protein